MKMNRSNGKIAILSAIIALILIATILVNVIVISVFDGLATSYFGTVGGSGKSNTDSNIFYTHDYESADLLYDAETKLGIQMAQEGVVLLKNEDGLLPLGKNRTVSLFGAACVDLVCGGSGSGAGTVELNTDFKTALNAAGLNVNETLWKFYSEGKGYKDASGKKYGIGEGCIDFGKAFDWSVNEVPVSVIKAEPGLADTFAGTTAIYTISRTGGEDGDLARDMAAYGGERGQHYLELDAAEKGVIEYLNSCFEDIIIVVNTNNAFELGFVDEYEHIKSVIYAPGLGRMGPYGLANVISGFDGDEEISPSGHLVDTFAYDVYSSPAMQNMGDFHYGDSSFKYVSYSEGIYVGYRYYETRYEDGVIGTENVGDFDYSTTVAYPFGYGLSYTSFEWSDFSFAQPDAEGNMTVTVTVTNSGNRNGKEVVQVYFQSPYTDYDRENNVEKASVELCGYAKTSNLTPGESETLTITISLEEFRTYDAYGAGTYILDAGMYYVTAAKDAHDAVNNVLAAKGYEVDGNSVFVGSYEQEKLDVETFSVDSTTGTKIVNQFEDAVLDDVTYLTRQNWTMMEGNGLRYGEVSTYENPMEQNGVAFAMNVSDELLAKLKSTDSLTTDTTQYTDLPAREEQNGLEIIDLRGIDYENSKWDELVAELTLDEMRRIVYINGYSSLGAIASINKPTSNENDGPAGINDLQYHKSITTEGDNVTMGWATEVLIAQTFNDELAAEMGRLVGEEALFADNAGWYAPAVNIHRTPFAGRNFEYYSEDPYISGRLGHAVVNAAAQKGVICYTKHFALNDQETNRIGVATWSNEQAIREIYLEPFEMTFKNNFVTILYNDADTGELVEKEIDAALAVMTSFNRIGATWAGGYYPLLTEVLRNEWGFNGLILTDYNGGQGHMDTAQMLMAGGNSKLRTLDQGFKVSDLRKDFALANRAAESARRYLYVQAHSLVMNGLTSGVQVNAGFPVYKLMLLGLDVVSAVGIFFLVRGIVKTVRKKNEIKIVKE